MNLMEQLENVPERVQLMALVTKGYCAYCEFGEIENETSGLCICKKDNLLHWYNPDCLDWIIGEGTQLIDRETGDVLWRF